MPDSTVTLPRPRGCKKLIIDDFDDFDDDDDDDDDDVRLLDFPRKKRTKRHSQRSGPPKLGAWTPKARAKHPL